MAHLRTRFARLAVTMAAAAALGGCASRLGYEVSPPRRNQPVVVDQPRLHGGFLTTLGDRVELAGVSDRPVVLVFGQDSCLVCGREADELVAALGGVEPRKVKLISVLVGAWPEDAVAWKQDHRVPWTVGIDGDSSLFASYCAERTVPCNVVFVPGKGIVMNRNAPATPAELMRLTGPWED